MTTTNPLMALFAGEPALIEQGATERFRACLEAVVAHPHANEILAESAGYNDDGFWSADPDSWRAALRPYVVKDGILQIPVKGVLLNNFPWALGSYATGYDYIWRAFQRGCADYQAGTIKGIALICDSPGGMVAGCFDACDKMSALKAETKVPVRGFAHESAYSSCYAIISVADKIAVSRTGGVGSIGVVTTHMDVSGALDQAGVKITFIFAGKHKVDGNSTEPLPADVKARIQERIDELYGVFVSTVARNRGMEEQAVRDTEALCFTATQALSNGLADLIGSLDDAVSAFADDLDDQSDNTGEDAMADEAKTSAVDQAAHEAAVAAARAEGAGETATAVANAIKADRERQKAITGCEEAKGRESLAAHFALNTDMSVDDAKAALATAPKAGAEQTGVDFERAMNGSEHPNVGADAGEGGKDKADTGADAITLARAIGIRGVRPAPAKQ